MSTTEPAPSSGAFSLVGVAYGMMAVGLFLLWPAVIALVMAYVKRDDVPPLLGSHYRWLINTFWGWAVAWTLIIVAMVAVFVTQAIDWEALPSDVLVNVQWEVAGAAVFGGPAIAIVWLWVVYRLVRGAVRLSDGRPIP